MKAVLLGATDILPRTGLMWKSFLHVCENPSRQDLRVGGEGVGAPAKDERAKEARIWRVWPEDGHRAWGVSALGFGLGFGRPTLRTRAGISTQVSKFRV